MLKVNTSIHTILSIEHYSEHELSEDRSFLISRQSAAAATSHPESMAGSYVKVLGRALLATRTDVNSLWMLYPGMPAAPSSTAATTTPAPSNWCLVLLLPVAIPMFLKAQTGP
jgi:hypothetical protein